MNGRVNLVVEELRLKLPKNCRSSVNPEDSPRQDLRPYRAPDSELTDDQDPSPPWNESAKKCVESIMRWFVASGFFTVCVYHITHQAFMLLDEVLHRYKPYMTESYFELRLNHLFVMVVVLGVAGVLTTYLFSKAALYISYRTSSVSKVENYIQRYAQSVLVHPLALSGIFVLAWLGVHLLDVAIELLAYSVPLRMTGALAGVAAAPIALAASYPVFKAALRRMRKSLDDLGSTN